MIPIRRRRSPFEDVDVDRLNVFVPTILGAGVVASVAVLIADLSAKLGARRGRQRTAMLARSTLLQVVAPVAPASLGRRHPQSAGLRSRRTYAIVALVFASLGIYGLVGSFWNYWNPVEAFRGIGWLWSVSLIVSVTFLWLAAAAGAAALRWPEPPAFSRALLTRTPLGVTPQRMEHAAPALPPSEG